MPEGFDLTKPNCLNKHGLQTVSTGSVRVKLHTVVQQQQPAQAPKPGSQQAKAAAAAKGGAGGGKFPFKPEVGLGKLKGVLGVSALANSETAADRVKKRLEERRRAEARG